MFQYNAREYSNVIFQNIPIQCSGMFYRMFSTTVMESSAIMLSESSWKNLRKFLGIRTFSELFWKISVCKMSGLEKSARKKCSRSGKRKKQSREKTEPGKFWSLEICTKILGAKVAFLTIGTYTVNFRLGESFIDKLFSWLGIKRSIPCEGSVQWMREAPLCQHILRKIGVRQGQREGGRRIQQSKVSTRFFPCSD